MEKITLSIPIMCKLHFGAWYHCFLVLLALRKALGPRAQILVELLESRKVEPQVLLAPLMLQLLTKGARQVLGVLVDVFCGALAALVEECF